nr:PIG-L family deacetylase [Terrimesophilobacter mesophilus]
MSTVSTPHPREHAAHEHAPQEHILFVHAHPDDETIATGGTIALLLDAGAAVTLLTCTRGELGEVVPPELQHLAGDALGRYRESELAAAMHALGLADLRMLGADGARAGATEPHRFRDSGMQWGPAGAEPPSAPDPAHDGETLTSARLEAVVQDVMAVIAAVRPTAVVSYDERGGYGHPDHIRAHEAAATASLLMSVPFYTIVPDGGRAPDNLVVDVTAALPRKKSALEAYRTQLTVDGDTIVHSGGQSEPIRTVEVFRRFGQPEAQELEWDDLGILMKTVACVLGLLAGAVVGAVGTANHHIAASTVSLLLVAALLVGLRLWLGTRIVAFCAGVGIVAMVGILSLEGSGGSVLVQATPLGAVWAYVPIAIAVVGVAWPRTLRRARATMETSLEPGKAGAS